MTNITEPLDFFLGREGFDRSKIAEWVIGDKYVAVMNTEGNIGVCATLGTKMSDTLFRIGEPDIADPAHRIILNAWFNSVCNYRRDYRERVDIFDGVDFSKKGRIVMVGYFESLYEKFVKDKIELKVFDIQKESPVLTDISGFEENLGRCDTLILTGTTIFNNTFKDIVAKTGNGCSVYLLGPSNVLSEEMFNYRNVKVVFGSVFRNGDMRVLNKIADGSGTKGFLEYLNKVYISREASI